MKNSGGVFIGIVAAATAGVVLGMLITPKKGEDLRKDIKNTAGDWSKKVGNLLADGKEQFKNTKTAYGDGMSDFKREIKKTTV